METRTVSDAVAFSEEKMKKNALFDSPHLFYDAYCLLPGQFQKVHAHEDSDKVYYVLRGARQARGAELGDDPQADAAPDRTREAICDDGKREWSFAS